MKSRQQANQQVIISHICGGKIGFLMKKEVILERKRSTVVLFHSYLFYKRYFLRSKLKTTFICVIFHFTIHPTGCTKMYDFILEK